MDMSGDDAMAELRECEADLKAYGEERGLTLKLDPAYPGAPKPDDQPGPVKHCIWSLIGEMPGGTIGRLRHQASFGKVLGVSAKMHHTVFIGRQPETVGYVPLLACRPDEFGANLFAWAEDSRPRQEQTFESLELDRRFVIEIAKGQDQVWLYRLFTPTLIDWLAHETPPDFGFKLSSGSFSCEVPQYRGQHRADGQVDFEHLDLVAGCGGRVAGRFRDEVLEQVGLGKVPDPRSAEANRNWSKGKSHGFIIGTILKFFGEGEDNSAAEFATGQGFAEEVDPAVFHSAHIMLPLPGAATDVFAGKQPDGRSAHLVWLEYESEYYGLRYYVGVVTPLDRDGPDLWLDEEEVQASAGVATTDIPREAIEAAGENHLAFSTGGGNAIAYVGSTGWEGRPGKAEIGAMIENASRIFTALEQ